tara:strand:- start:5206 stop:5625 length:420 start_codon:yes stop_codon:yes gene_type:complete
MEKRKMVSKKREEEKLLKDRAELVRAALQSGKMIKKEICDATGLSMVELKNLFQIDREIYAEYVVLRKTIMDIAADNIVAIVNDPQHPQHFQASKELLKNFKSEFDETLESSDNVLQINPTSRSQKNRVKIVFSQTKGK